MSAMPTGLFQELGQLHEMYVGILVRALLYRRGYCLSIYLTLLALQLMQAKPATVSRFLEQLCPYVY